MSRALRSARTNGAVVGGKPVTTMGAPQSGLPLNGVLRSMANKIINERVAPRRERNYRPPSARFTDDQVRLMRDLQQRGVTAREIATLVTMPVDSIRAILIGTNYSHVL